MQSGNVTLPNITPQNASIDEASFWAKLARSARWAGRETVERALQLYYAAGSPNVPAWAKAVIFGSLAYFILPTDAVPDFIPGAGYADDLGTLMAAFGIVAFYITPEVKGKAKETLKRWFTVVDEPV